MKKLALIIPFTLSILSSGCSMLQVGEDEFTCPNNSKGATCSSARQIHDLTNDRNSLEGLHVSGGEVLDYDPNDEDAQEKAEAKKQEQKNKETVKVVEEKQATNDVYKPLSSLRHDTLPEAELITEPSNRTFGAVKGVENEHGQLMVRRQSPMALAPEPLAVLQQPKTMRILIASWTDADGDLHMPGFVYVEVEPKKWLVGEQANDRPGRIVPLQIQQVTQEEERRQEKSKKGYSSLGMTEKGNY